VVKQTERGLIIKFKLQEFQTKFVTFEA
jgi:hypothetical protein